MNRQDHRVDCFHLGVKALVRCQEGKILLLERHHQSQKIYWDIPGGRLHRGESLKETLLREVEEETGLKEIETIQPYDMILTDIRIPFENDNVGLIFSIFLCNILVPFHPKLSDEHKNFDWFTPLEASQKLIQYPNDFRENLARLCLT